MALFLGSAIARGNILDISESEAAFHPWWDQLQVQSVKSTHQYFGFFRKEFLISRFQSWDWFQNKGLIILHSIGVFTNV